MNGEREFVEHFMYVFKAPVITWPGYEDLAKDHKDRITTYRMAGVKDIQDKKATDYEAMLYISTASFASPLGHEWVKIYTQLFRQYHGAENSDAIGITEEKLYDNELHQLGRLKSWLYQKQMDHLKPMMKEEKAKKTRDLVESNVTTPTLFDFMEK